ncbi:uncharacterized protein LOC132697963 [Cylas formicarius]|uniref:uncharacterized protein LOC132697963 n=1 Tax=Cylas formicarius TaxID=197179 RepID=UPI00295854F4|nr:uncharacterized protein LOC132697963 [Cylas formicarius]
MANILLDRLDPVTRKLFEQKHSSNEMPTYGDIYNFLEQHCAALESLELSLKQNVPPKSNRSNFTRSPRKRTNVFFTNKSQRPLSLKQNTCFWCKKGHLIYRCDAFLAQPVHERVNFIKNNKGCTNCLTNLHVVAQCSSQKRCRHCGYNHLSLLCLKGNPSPPPGSPVSESRSMQESDELTLHRNITVGIALNDHDTLLSTALLHIRDVHGNWHPIRAILDSGAQTSFLTKRCATMLGLSKYNISISINGLESMSMSAYSAVHCEIAPLATKSHTFHVETVVVDQICNKMPNMSFDPNSLEFLKELKLADPQWYTQSEVQLLIGAEIYGSLIQDGHLYFGPNVPTCLNTVFGSTLIGEMPLDAGPSNSKTISAYFTTVSNIDLNNALQKFWETEEIPNVLQKPPSDIYCEKYYADTTTRDTNGRYTVSLPFRITSPDFGDTRALTLKRFYSLENRLLRNKDLYHSYSEIMEEYLAMGHMRPVSRPSDEHLHEYFYIGHLAVIKEDSRSTPVRIVFDASSHATNKPSLNQVLYAGPKLQRDLVTILLNFRLHKYCFVTDISKMYRMINVESSQRKYQRILWRFNPEDPVSDYELQTVTFGINCSPYLAIRTLLQLADDYHDLPLASKILKESVYIDDCAVSCPDLEQLSLMKNQLIELLRRGGFELKKWASNEPKLLADLPETHVGIRDFSLDLENVKNTRFAIVGFCDAPERGMCATIFFRVSNQDGTYKSYFVCAKSKVAPVKRISLPRLELCSAVLLAKLMHFVQRSFANKIIFQNVIAFTDSTVALSWIKGASFGWKTFVANRVTYIQEKIAAYDWNHVPSEFNAADPGSRGLLPSDLIQCTLWWQGPAFLRTSQELWEFTKIKIETPSEAFEEERRIVLTSTITPHFLDTMLNNISNARKLIRPLLGNLPKFRVSQAKAFENVGVDLTGSFPITMNRLRGAKRLKAYIVLFICCCTKAVHLEIVSDLSADTFLAAFRRFMARRGRVSNVYSDNGTNFVAASKHLKEIYAHVAIHESIRWHFNPPSAPHMGGLWESNIKSAKTHLLGVIGEQILTFEELYTCTTQVEAILNSRPLCPVSTDPSDLTALTPGHFLSLEPLSVIPNPDTSQLRTAKGLIKRPLVKLCPLPLAI